MRLDEALIKVPEQTLAEIIQWATEQVLWWCAEQLYQNKTLGNINELVTEIDGLCAAHGLNAEDFFHNPYKKNVSVEKFVFHDLPDNYPKSSSNEIFVAFDWRPTSSKVIGSYLPSKNAILLYPLAIDWFKGYPKLFHGNIIPLLREINSTIHHELSHAVQFLSLASKAPAQIAKDYTSNTDGVSGNYYISPIEYGPTLESDIQDFINSISVNNEHGIKYNLGNEIRVFVGMKKSRVFGMITPSPFFLALKKSSEERYRRAVAVFAKEVTHRLATQNT